MTLLQAAFSHYGFAQHFDGDRDGFFRALSRKEKLPDPSLSPTARTIVQLESYTRSLRCLRGRMRLESVGQQAGSAESDATAPNPLLRPSRRSCSTRVVEDTLTARKINNLNADEFIKDHSDVCGRQVAHAVFAAVEAVL